MTVGMEVFAVSPWLKRGDKDKYCGILIKTRTVFSEENVHMSPTSLNRPIVEKGCIYNLSFFFCVCVVNGGHFPKSALM